MSADASKPEQKSGDISPIAAAMNTACQTEKDNYESLLKSNQKMAERIEKLESLLKRAVIEHERERDVIAYLKQIAFGKSSESRIVKKLNNPRADDMSRQESLFPGDDVFNEIESTVHGLGKDGITSDYLYPPVCRY